MKNTDKIERLRNCLRRWRWAALLVLMVVSGCSTPGKQSPLPWDRPMDYPQDRDRMFRPGDINSRRGG